MRKNTKKAAKAAKTPKPKAERKLLDPRWICEQLKSAADDAYENDVAHIVAKIIGRNPDEWRRHAL